MNRVYLWHEHIFKKDCIYKLQSTNVLCIPILDKIMINICINEAINDSKQILPCITALELITNQKPIIYRSKKSIAAFKLRKNTVIGCKVLLRKKNMYDFLDSFVFLVLPKLINFKGFTNSHKQNNINIGVFDLLSFPQLNDAGARFQKKLGATFTFVAKSNFQSINLILNSYQIPQKIY